CEMIGLLTLPRFIKWVGRTKAFNTAISLIIIGLLFILISGFIVPQSVITVIVGAGLLRIGSGFMIGITTVSLADVIDYGEVKFCQFFESYTKSTNKILTKKLLKRDSLIVGERYSKINYTPNEEQTALSYNGLRILLILLLIIFVIVAAFFSHKYLHLKCYYL